MPNATVEAPATNLSPVRLQSGQAWTNVAVAALAMAATLPGRTMGLGYITEPLLRDFGLATPDGRTQFANINLVATLVGSLFCIPAGWLLDRWGCRPLLVALGISLAAVVFAMAAPVGLTVLSVLILFSRGFGQSALSVASISLVGKSFPSRSGVPMSVYSLLVAVTFGAAMGAVGKGIENFGWKAAWAGIGVGLLAFSLLAWFFVRLQADGRSGSAATGSSSGFTLQEAMRTSAFWVFACGASLYGLVISGMSLFYESILAERGFDEKVFHNIVAVSPLIGLAGQAVCGEASLRIPLHRLLGAALLLYGAGLFYLPFAKSLPQVWIYACLVGVAGGFITVLFFAVWEQYFGAAQLGRIQGAAQMATVFASAVGPRVFTECLNRTGSYAPALFTLSAVVAVLAVLAFTLTAPTPKDLLSGEEGNQ